MKLAVRYKGPEPDRGRMGALDVGPAILGIGEMVAEASRLLYGDKSRIRVDVRADFAHASFGIEFYAVANLGDLLSANALAEIANVCEILGFTGILGGGLLRLLRWQRGRKIDRVERTEGGIQLVIHDESRNVSVTEYNIFVNTQIRKGLEAVVAPLEKAGVEELEIKAESEEPVVIDREHRSDFGAAPIPEREVSEDRYTATLEIVALSFRKGNKWRFSQGDSGFYAEILDEAFLAKVELHRETFGSGDALRCEVEVRTTRRGTDLVFEHRILRVLQHLPAERGKQLSLE